MTSPPRLALLLGGVLLATNVHAQPAEGPIVSGVVGIVAIDSNTDLAVSGSAGYRFNRVFGLGVELTSVPALSRDAIVYRPYITNDAGNSKGRVTIFTTNVRLEVPTTSPRVVPYAVAGGGIANVKESADVIIEFHVPVLTASVTAAPAIYPPPERDYLLSFSTVNLALTFGGGVSFLAGGHLSIDVDFRYLRLMGDLDRNIGRFGGGVSYRF